MARCNDEFCSCRITAGDGIVITGTGTPSNPFEISTDFPGIADSFRVNDTTTVNLTLLGAGSPANPFVLRADATIKVTQLADVQDPEGGPAVGESLVWTGSGTAGHWEFKTLPPAPAGAVNVAAGISGSGTAVDPIKVRVIGTTTGGPTTGLEVYTDSAGNLRAVQPLATAVDWSTIVNKPSAFPPTPHTHPLADISDATAYGRSLAQTADAAAARTLLGATAIGNGLFTAPTLVVGRETLRFYRGNGPTTPVAGDIRFRDA